MINGDKATPETTGTTDGGAASQDAANQSNKSLANAVLESLRTFSDKIGSTIATGSREGVLRPTEETYTRHPVDKGGVVKDTDFGVELVDYQTEEFVKESWFRATRTVVWSLEGSDEYSETLSLLRQSSIGPEMGKRLLDSFAHSISYRFLETDSVDARREYVYSQLETVKKHLAGDRFRHSSEVRLVGLVAATMPIELVASGVSLSLRRVKKEDLIEEGWAVSNRRRDIFRPRPTAILHLSKLVEWENEIQKAVWQAVTILRLFKVGSVRELSYTHETDSYFAMGGTHGSHQHYSEVTKTRIDDADRDRLIIFWQKMSGAVPSEGYGRYPDRIDPVGIAYQRYSDALLAWGGTVERRISDAVIGLESLLLSENDELSYRLRLRTAKLLSFVGYDPHFILNVIKDAYKVRSAFLHGDNVDGKTRRRIERQYKSLNNLLLHTLDQLRCCIVIATLRKMPKDEVVNRLERSFIDEDSGRDLSEMMAEARSVLSPTQERTE
jgi:hypothetical protein